MAFVIVGLITACVLIGSIIFTAIGIPLMLISMLLIFLSYRIQINTPSPAILLILTCSMPTTFVIIYYLFYDFNEIRLLYSIFLPGTVLFSIGSNWYSQSGGEGNGHGYSPQYFKSLIRNTVKEDKELGRPVKVFSGNEQYLKKDELEPEITSLGIFDKIKEIAESVAKFAAQEETQLMMKRIKNIYHVEKLFSTASTRNIESKINSRLSGLIRSDSNLLIINFWLDLHNEIKKQVKKIKVMDGFGSPEWFSIVSAHITYDAISNIQKSYSLKLKRVSINHPRKLYIKYIEQAVAERFADSSNIHNALKAISDPDKLRSIIEDKKATLNSSFDDYSKIFHRVEKNWVRTYPQTLNGIDFDRHKKDYRSERFSTFLSEANNFINEKEKKEGNLNQEGFVPLDFYVWEMYFQIGLELFSGPLEKFIDDEMAELN